MKKTILTGASILALSIAAPALGQSLPEPNNPQAPTECAGTTNNCSVVNQEGTNGLAEVTQTNSANTSEINQTAASQDVVAKVNQSGTNATSSIEQSGGPGQQVGQVFERNTVVVNQKGDGAESYVVQGASRRLDVLVNQDGDSFSFVDQEGANTEAEVRQRGDLNESYIYQSANGSRLGSVTNNSIGVDQLGDGNISEVTQGDLDTTAITENNLTGSVLQTGNSNESIILQTNAGGRNEATAKVNQTGDDNFSDITQSGLLGLGGGEGTLVSVTQLGDDNRSTVSQTNRSIGDVAPPSSQVVIKQNGDDNDSTVKQSSLSGRVNVTQTQSGANLGTGNRANRIDGGTDLVRANFSNVAQSGNGVNEADVIQVGELNRSDIRQSNNNGTANANVTQDGIFNNSEIEQTAAAEAIVEQFGTYGDNDSSIIQNADGASATVNQFGNSTTNGPSFPTNQSFITQDDKATAKVTQTGSQNRSEVNQKIDAFDAVAIVNQETAPAAIGSGDDLNDSKITQSATTSAFVNQIGQSNTSTVTQMGDNTAPDNGFTYAVQIDQLGFNGNSSVIQNGLGNEAGLTQLAGSELADSMITQDGHDNLAVVVQGGLGNESVVMQGGNNNTATVSQYSDNNFSTVNQSGNGNTATVTQGTAPAL